MILYKINDNVYVNIEMITSIYWNKDKNFWQYDVVGEYPSYCLTVNEKDKLIAYIKSLKE